MRAAIDRRTSNALRWSCKFSGIGPLVLFIGCSGPTYDLQLRPQEGEIWQVTTEMAMSQGHLVIRRGGQVAEGSMSMHERSVTEVDFLKCESQRPIRIKVSYLVNELQTRTAFPGQDAAEEISAGDLVGRSVLFEKSGERWTSRLIGIEPTDAQRNALRSVTSPLEEDLIPDRPVRVGESWDLKSEDLPLFKGLVSEEAAGSVKVTLEQIVSHNGVQCAKMAVDMDLTGKMDIGLSKNGLVSMKLRGYVYRSLADHIDIATEFEGKMTCEGDDIVEGELVHMSVSGGVRGSETTLRE